MPRRRKTRLSPKSSRTQTLLDPAPPAPPAVPGVVRLETVKVRIDHLVQLKRSATDAATEYAEAVAKTAEDSGCRPGVVKRFVSARLSEKFNDRKEEAQQLSLLFEEVGE